MTPDEAISAATSLAVPLKFSTAVAVIVSEVLASKATSFAASRSVVVTVTVIASVLAVVRPSSAAMSFEVAVAVTTPEVFPAMEFMSATLAVVSVIVEV